MAFNLRSRLLRIWGVSTTEADAAITNLSDFISHPAKSPTALYAALKELDKALDKLQTKLIPVVLSVAVCLILVILMLLWLAVTGTFGRSLVVFPMVLIMVFGAIGLAAAILLYLLKDLKPYSPAHCIPDVFHSRILPQLPAWLEYQDLTHPLINSTVSGLVRNIAQRPKQFGVSQRLSDCLAYALFKQLVKQLTMTSEELDQDPNIDAAKFEQWGSEFDKSLPPSRLVTMLHNLPPAVLD